MRIWHNLTKVNTNHKGHRLGNMIAGFFCVLDGLTMIITCGKYTLGSQLQWSFYRRKTGKFLDPKF